MTEQDLKMEKESAVDFMIRIVKDWINNETYKSGDKLPSESELCHMTNISRGSVREAMKILSALGIVDIKQGSGTYITDRYVTPLVEPLLLNLKKSGWSVHDLMDFREMIEKSVMELIIRNASEEEIAELESENNLMKLEIENNADQSRLLELDINFHRKMAKCTQNTLFEILYNFTMDFISDETKRLYNGNDSMGYISFLLHQRMVDAIRHHDLETAKETVVEAMKNHVSVASERSAT